MQEAHRFPLPPAPGKRFHQTAVPVPADTPERRAPAPGQEQERQKVLHPGRQAARERRTRPAPPAAPESRSRRLRRFPAVWGEVSEDGGKTWTRFPEENFFLVPYGEDMGCAVQAEDREPRLYRVAACADGETVLLSLIHI